MAKNIVIVEIYFTTGINRKGFTSSRSGNSEISINGYFPALLSACEASLIVSFHSLGFLLLGGILIRSTYKYTLVGKLGVFVCLFVVCQVQLFCLNFTFGFLLALLLLSQTPSLRDGRSGRNYTTDHFNMSIPPQNKLNL